MHHQPHERRRTPRYPFIAEAEITDSQSSVRLNAQISELSLNGCYVDVPNTLPVSTPIVIKILANAECFEATAHVVYAHPGLGIGVAFEGVSIKSGVTLRGWLASAASTLI